MLQTVSPVCRQVEPSTAGTRSPVNLLEGTRGALVGMCSELETTSLSLSPRGPPVNIIFIGCLLPVVCGGGVRLGVEGA